MRKKLSSQFFNGYLTVLIFTVFAAFCAMLILSAADSLISATLIKNRYTAASVMQDNFLAIDATEIVATGGGVQVIDRNYHVVRSEGLDTIGKSLLTTAEFTEFLEASRDKDNRYHYDIAYNEAGGFWLIVTYPTSVRLNFSVVYNPDAPSQDLFKVAGIIAGVVVFYLAMLALFVFVYSRATAGGITKPLKKLSDGARLLREGDYSARVDLHLKNEFAELENTFNDMAARIERETALRKQAEDNRKRMIADISHDLKNPLTNIVGYAEHCLQSTTLTIKEARTYIEVIKKNGGRAETLLGELFELSKLESPDYKLEAVKTDLAETLRAFCCELIPRLEQAGFTYSFDIPEGSVFVNADSAKLTRVFINLGENAIRYNPPGTEVSVRFSLHGGAAEIVFADNGIGIPDKLAEELFLPFSRGEQSRSRDTGGSGLGLYISKKIIELHGGTIALEKEREKGAAFLITIPII